MSDQTLNTTIPSFDPTVSYQPSGTWSPVGILNGSTGGRAMFDQGSLPGYITYTFPQPATGFEYWGFQRSDHWLMSICFDCPPGDTGGDQVGTGLNITTNGSEPPRLLYSVYNLTYAIHNVSCTNLFDPRTSIKFPTPSYGQMNLDHFVLVSPTTPPTSTSTSSTQPDGTATAGAGGSSSSGSHVGPIVGGVLGGIAGLVILFLLFFFFWWRKGNNRGSGLSQDMNGGFELKYEPPPGDGIRPSIVVSPQQQPILETSPIMSLTPSTVLPTISPMIMPFVSPMMVGMQDAGSFLGPSVSSGPSEIGGDRPLPARAGTATTASTTIRPRKITSELTGSAVTRSGETVTPSVYPASPDANGPPISHRIPRRRDQDAGFLQGDELAEDILPPDYSAATGTSRPRND
ncbi:hypothetical protein DACRYDRAFT_116178 [Dacryopinax primogenitus]|uniref:Mid2 domain-containing protein n=1 Tax=Dacryopinax primogenitus (strain DJM 731) TaxID=1858805 RepID=M5GDL1_DACPD|nr:uncharacterized protein DACRYDRAFT_116178 [Dacryopinax primogenitus]EJU02503.1 hypothetical protein DACRYDRAFT_116178 [Dacryopinax primogenitus]